MDNQIINQALSSLNETSESSRPKSNTTSGTGSECGDSRSSRLWKILSAEKSPQFRADVIGLNEVDAVVKRMSIWTEAWIKAAAINKREEGTSKRLALAGVPGCGKSHALRAAHRFLDGYASELFWERLWGHSALPEACFGVWSRLMERSADGFDDWMSDAKRASWVFLDDVGADVDKFKSGEPNERLRRVLELSERRWMMITTNIEPSDWPKKFDLRVSDRLSAFRAPDLAGAKSWRTRL